MSLPVKIVIVGNGFGGIYALKKMHKLFCGNSNVKISLIGEKNYFLFTPLLHEVATGSINPENIIEPIRKILGCCLEKFYLGKAENINTTERTVTVGNEKLHYDYLILAPGAETNFYNISGAEEYSLPLKTLEDAIKIKNRCILQIENGSHIQDRLERQKKLAFVVVGGGATGVELAAELAEFVKETFARFYSKEVIDDISITLIQKDPELLPQFHKKIREKSLKVLHKKGIIVLLNEEVQKVSTKQIFLSNGKSIDTETVVWVAGIKPANMVFDREIEKASNGKLVINEYLQLENHKEIYALGDATLIRTKGENINLPALAQVTTKQANTVVQNIKRSMEEKSLKPFVYHSSGSLISLGNWMALGEVSNFVFGGRITWWVWRTVYLFKLISWEKKLQVAIDWTINIFLPRDISQF
ncbi:NAD(P)/FAD-dependent oxidoreductase [Candidatus Nomurabacteria bacterium]|nr:NAD(P)/FAD-dependent oxidoreductase [Candidatus Nomurabacteria bacterium]